MSGSAGQFPPPVFVEEIRRVTAPGSVITFEHLGGVGLAEVKYRRDDQLEFRVGSDLGEVSDRAQRVVAAHEVAHLALNHRSDIARNTALGAGLVASGLIILAIVGGFQAFLSGEWAAWTLSAVILAALPAMVVAIQPYLWVERRCEYAADLYAARQFGRVLTGAIAMELERLASRREGSHQRWVDLAFKTHPTWSQRAERVAQTIDKKQWTWSDQDA